MTRKVGVGSIQRFCLLVQLIWVQTLWAQTDAANATTALRPDHPEAYIVVTGDTLWDISGRFLTKPWLWPELWENNPQIADPNLIYPGDTIALVWREGAPRLTLARRGANGANDVVRLSPSVRTAPLRAAVPPIRMDAIEPFLVRNRVVAPDALDDLPYVLSSTSERLISGGGDQVFVRGARLPRGRVSIVRIGQHYRDPDTGDALGREAVVLGNAEVTRIEGDIATLRLDEVREEIRAGDRVLPTADRKITPDLFPRPPAASVSGTILAVLGGVANIGRNDVVVVNVGAADGVAVGDTLVIDKQSVRARDPVTREWVQLPAQRAGYLMLYEVFDRVAYALVLSAEQPLAVFDRVRNP
jgi:hypothetical protein